MERKEIAEKLAITEPFLMLESFTLNAPENTAQALQSLHKDDWFYACHLPNEQVMPATLITEGMLQTLVLLIYETYDHGANRAFITSINVRVLQAAKPSQTLHYLAILHSFRRGIAKGSVMVTTNDGTKISEGDFKYASPSFMALPSH